MFMFVIAFLQDTILNVLSHQVVSAFCVVCARVCVYVAVVGGGVGLRVHIYT